MQAKKEAALAGAAATVSNELYEAGETIHATQNIGKSALGVGGKSETSGTGWGETTPQDNSSAGGPSDDPNARAKEAPVERILSRLGRAVLLPIRPGKKCPTEAGWQETTREAMSDPAYVARLNAGCNIGVLLGAASDGLCSIDMDHDDEVEPFLALNPRLRPALRTRRSRGGNIWIRVEGKYPSLTKLKTNSGKSWGEWRADGSQTVIYGAVCDQAQGETEPIKYKVVQNGEPARLRFDEIVWPPHLSLPWAKSTSAGGEAHDAPTSAADPDDDHIIVLFSGDVGIRECADKLYRRIGPTNTLFQRAGFLVETREDDDGHVRLQIVSPTAFRSRIEAYGNIMAWRSGEGGKRVLKPVACPEEAAKALIEAPEMGEYLPRISVLVGCPVLIQTAENKLAVLPRGYHPEKGGILVTGGGIPLEIDFNLAVPLLTALLDDFDFQSAGDRSRALSQFLTPALKLGGFIRGFIPADVAEADQSQSGKTYRQRVVSSIYNEASQVIARREGGVGSLDESFAQALIAGRPFIQFDNLRGKFDSQFVETFLTADRGFPARVPYRGEVLIDPTKYFLQLTSNGVETTRDLANRSCIIRIRKRHGHVFRRYGEGRDLLAHVRAYQSVYLGCVFAVIRRWVEHGKPRTDIVGHDFRDWAQPLDWIIQNLFGAAPLLEGHQGAQARVSNPALTFLRNVALHIKDAKRLGESFAACGISELCDEYGLAIPHLQAGKEDHAARQVGVLLGRVFRESDTVQIDDFSVTRTIRETGREDGGGRHDVKFYTFSEITVVPIGAQAAQG